MTDEAAIAAPAPSAPDHVSAEYIATWAACAGQVLTQIAGTPVTVETLSAPPAEGSAAEGDVEVTVVADGSLRGEMSLRIPRAAALGLAQLFLSEPPDAAGEFRPDHREAVEELLRQVVGQVATALKARWGEVQLRVEPSAPRSWPPGVAGWLGSPPDSPCRVWIEWQLSEPLHAALAAALSPAADPQEAAEASPAQDPLIVPGNLDLLMDVELEVTLRFGERSMRLQEILELGAGSVVELDRRIEEPAELLLDGRVIARGEVVVVDGNYGLRVLEVASVEPLRPAASA